MADWNRVQGTKTTSPVANSLAFSASVGVGNVVVAAILLSTGFTLAEGTITDDQGNPYKIVSSFDDGILNIYGIRSVGIITNGAKTLTFPPSGSPGTFWIVIEEFSPPTGTVTIASDGATITSNSAGLAFAAFNTTKPDDLVWAASLSSGQSVHGSSWTAGQGDSSSQTTEWGIQLTPATVTMDLASQNNHFWGPAFALNGASSAALSLAGGSRVVNM